MFFLFRRIKHTNTVIISPTSCWSHCLIVCNICPLNDEMMLPVHEASRLQAWFHLILISTVSKKEGVSQSQAQAYFPNYLCVRGLADKFPLDNFPPDKYPYGQIPGGTTSPRTSSRCDNFPPDKFPGRQVPIWTSSWGDNGHIIPKCWQFISNKSIQYI